MYQYILMRGCKSNPVESEKPPTISNLTIKSAIRPISYSAVYHDEQNIDNKLSAIHCAT